MTSVITGVIVERLRYLTIHGDQAQAVTVMEEAAVEIERLRKTAIETMQEMLRRANEIERLRLALKDIECRSIDHTEACRMAGMARRALEPKP